MNILYISSNYENVQPQLVDALNKQDEINAFLCHYDLRKKEKTFEMPEYGHTFSLRNHIHGPFFYIFRLKRIKSIISDYYRSYDIELTHANMAFRDGIISYLIWKENKTPYIVSIRNTDLNARFLWNDPFIKKYCLEVLRHAKYIICLSDAYRKKLLDRIPGDLKIITEPKIKIIPNGIDAFYLMNACGKEKKASEDVRRLLFAGKITKNKNLESVVKAVEILRERGSDFQLSVVGEIIDREYESIIKKSGFIEYHKECPKEELINYYQEADIFVMPSHTETFGLVYAEAMSQGLPVIYTRGQGFDSAGKDGIIGYAVSDTDSNEIAQRITDICGNYNDLSVNCSTMANEYDWNTITAKLAKIYKAK